MSRRASRLVGLAIAVFSLLCGAGCEKARREIANREYRQLRTSSVPDEERAIRLARFVEARSDPKTNPHLAQSCATIGRYHARAGHMALAAAWYERAVAAAPGNPVLLNLAGYHYAQLGTSLDRAIAMLTRAVRITVEGDDPPRQLAFRKDSLGWAYRARGDLRRAIALLREARDLAPEIEIIAKHLDEARRELAAREDGERPVPPAPLDQRRPTGGKSTSAETSTR